MLYALIIADIVMAVVFILRLPHLPPQIPLFYSKTWGEDQLADFWLIFILPALLHLFIFLNSYLYNRFFLPDRFVKKIISILHWFLIIAVTFLFIKILISIS